MEVSVGNDADGNGESLSSSRRNYPLSDLFFFRAGVDSQCERTGEALIQALRDDVRLLTLLKPELDAEDELELLDDRTNS
jgi:hypothetical protein